MCLCWHQEVPFLCFGSWKSEWYVRTGPVKGQVLSSGFCEAELLIVDLWHADTVLCWSSRRSCLFQQHNSSLGGSLSLLCLHMASCHAVVEFLKKMWFSNPAHYCFFNMSIQARNEDQRLERELIHRSVFVCAVTILNVRYTKSLGSVWF